MGEKLFIGRDTRNKRGKIVIRSRSGRPRPLVLVKYIDAVFTMNATRIVEANVESGEKGFVELDFVLTAKDDKLKYMNIKNYEIVLVFIKNSLKFNEITSSSKAITRNSGQIDNHTDYITVSESGGLIDPSINFFTTFDGYSNIDFSSIAGEMEYILHTHYYNDDDTGFGMNLADVSNVGTTPLLELGEKGNVTPYLTRDAYSYDISKDYYANIDYADIDTDGKISIDSYNFLNYVDIMSIRYIGDDQAGIYRPKDSLPESYIKSGINTPLLTVKLDINQPDNDTRYKYLTDSTGSDVDYTLNLFQKMHIIESDRTEYIYGMDIDAFTGGVHVCL